MSKQCRDVGTEVFRALAMLGICLIHTFSLGGGGGTLSGFVSSALLTSVCAFVFISGYYGVSFRWSKLFRLYGLAAFAAALTTLAYHLIDPVECGNVLKRFAYTFSDYWFLNAYAVLMLMAPLLNLVLKESDKPGVRAALWLVVVCTIGWSFLAQLPLLRTYLPKSPGLHNYSGFMFMGIYILASFWRQYVEPRNIATLKLFVALMLLLVLSSLYPLCMEAYSSPFSIGVAAIAFTLVRRVPCPAWIGRFCAFLAPSLFSVYLLHTHAFGFHRIIAYKAYLLGLHIPYPVTCVLLGVGVFFVCIAVDLMRRAVWESLRLKGRRD